MWFMFIEIMGFQVHLPHSAASSKVETAFSSLRRSQYTSFLLKCDVLNETP